MFGPSHYVPILRWKQAERFALRYLHEEDRKRITPLIELLIFNFLFLRRKLGKKPSTEETVRHSSRFYVYACAGIFFIGMLYGVLMISQGELPRTILPLLLVPLSLAIYCLIVARRSRTHKPDGPQQRA